MVPWLSFPLSVKRGTRRGGGKIEDTRKERRKTEKIKERGGLESERLSEFEKKLIWESGMEEGVSRILSVQASSNWGGNS